MKEFFNTVRLIGSLLLHRATPWYVRLLMVAALLYVLVPTDLYPDFLPPLGWLDDLAVAPFLFYLALRLTPPGLAADLPARLAGKRPGR